MSDAFGKWYAEHPRFDYDEALEVWQAAERQALERAAQACEREAADSKRHRLHEYAAGANICALEIRALMQDAQSGEEKQ